MKNAACVTHRRETSCMILTRVESAVPRKGSGVKTFQGEQNAACHHITPGRVELSVTESVGGSE